MQYLFILGRNFELSRAELLNFCDEVFSSPEKSIFIGENLRFENPRNLPKSDEQLFLDRLGGTIRFGEVIGEFFSRKDCFDKMTEIIDSSATEGIVPKVGYTVFGGGKTLLGDFMGDTKKHYQKKDQKVRIENFAGTNMNSGQIFDRRLIKKGNEFVIWKNNDSFLLAKTVANQNLRNYTLRDRKKSFRDSKMGMLPPKLAQILINLANPATNDLIIDPFCGSGTINTEAAVMGLQTQGSDINASFVSGAEKNFEEMSEKFRFPLEAGTFFTEDATKIKWENKNGVICTEGFLGTNFEKTPTKDEIQENARLILKIWKNIFKELEDSNIKKITLCLPCWNTKEGKVSISDKFFTNIKTFGFAPQQLSNRRYSFYYERDKAFVAREICVIERV